MISLLPPQFVVSSAECLLGPRQPGLVRLGEQVRSEEEMECDQEGLCDLTVQDRRVGQVVIHHQYRGDHGRQLDSVEQLYKVPLEGEKMNNIAIIKLEEKVQETDYVSPICINLRVGFKAEYQTLNIELSIILRPQTLPTPALRSFKTWKSLAGRGAGDFIIRKYP